MGDLVFRFKRKTMGWLRALKHPSTLPTLTFLAAHRSNGTTPVVPMEPTPPAAGEEFLTAPPPLPSHIPPIVFQTWKSRTVIPDNYRIWRSSFAQINPGFRILLWDDDDNRAFVAARFPWFLETYNAYPREIYRADAVRPLFLYLFGGFYADMDSECLRPLSTLQGRGDVLLGRMGWNPAFPHSVPNALMASRPFQLFWLIYIAMMQERASGADVIANTGPEECTGPILLKDAYDFYAGATPAERLARAQPILDKLPANWAAQTTDGKLELLHPDIWYPVDWTNPVHRKLRAHVTERKQLLDRQTALRLFPKATMVTYWSHSW